MRAAAIDIGTNTVRLLVADVSDGSLRDVVRRTEVVGLGRGVDRAGVLGSEGMEAAVRALESFAVDMQRVRPDAVRVVATSASRDARNAEQFLRRVARVLGSNADVISGEDEANLSFRGAAWGAALPGPHLVIDPGGGSTEFVGGDGRAGSVNSVDIGSVRLTDRMLPDRPPRPADLDAARLHVRELFVTVPMPDPAATVIGVAGTFTSLAAIHLDLAEHDRDDVHGTALAVDDLEALVDRLAPLNLAETRAIASLDPRRAPVILAGAVVAVEAVARTGTDTVVVSESDLLEGVVLGLAGAL